jgi:hypothetical protein
VIDISITPYYYCDGKNSGRDVSRMVTKSINLDDGLVEKLETSGQKAFLSKKEMLLVAESSLSKDWSKAEEDKAWADL